MSEENLTDSKKIVGKMVAVMRRHGYQTAPWEDSLQWLDDQLAVAAAVREAELENLSIYQSNRPETRSEGAFSGRLREQQAKSARMAMLGVMVKLERAEQENAKLRVLLSGSSYHEFVLLSDRLDDLINRGKGESEDADHLREAMDTSWYRMTEEQRKILREKLIEEALDAKTTSPG